MISHKFLEQLFLQNWASSKPLLTNTLEIAFCKYSTNSHEEPSNAEPQIYYKMAFPLEF